MELTKPLSLWTIFQNIQSEEMSTATKRRSGKATDATVDHSNEKAKVAPGRIRLYKPKGAI